MRADHIHSQREIVFDPEKNSPFPLAQSIQLHVRALDLFARLISCHRCEKSARESRQTHHFDQAT